MNTERDKSIELETGEWLRSLDEVLRAEGPARAATLLQTLLDHARDAGVRTPLGNNTPYVNTIPPEEEPEYPGDAHLEWRIRSMVRWNALAMVVCANREEHGIGGHISTFASAATLYEVAFNHFFRSKDDPSGGDQIYFQGHVAPGIYARAFLEGRLSEEHLHHFRRELRDGGGLSSYPHPWLMPDFWEFPTVSMGLGPIMAIYQARFNRYLEDRGLRAPSGAKVWAFLGDGETDEPETLGALRLAGREKLENLIFVVNCNLQRLDGPVCGNGHIIQELEAVFRGAGWNVIKVIWGSDWDPLIAKDVHGVLVKRFGETVDGQYQKYTVESGAYTREHFFGTDPRLAALAADLTDEQIRRLSRGGHDPRKVYAAYAAAVRCQDAPTVILAKTIKGYGLGESGEGRNISHQQKKMNENELREFRTRFNIPISDEQIALAPFYRPPDDSPEIRYLQERRAALGGYVPRRKAASPKLDAPEEAVFDEFFKGANGRAVSTTMAFVRVLSHLLRHPVLGKLIVPIVPDEARTFGMETLFRQVGIHAHHGQRYEPVDADNFLYYREIREGQILEEGISEAGAMSSFIAAGTAYATHGINAIPFFIYYSMFGFQRIGDLIWAAGDLRTRGFLVGATSGRTTLAGEGLQHQDGHSHVLASTIPNLLAYDPAFAFELAVIVREGIRRMYEQGEAIFYYLTLTNENYPMPPIPEGAKEGILRGMYRFRRGHADLSLRVSLLGSGAIMNEVLKASELLETRYGVAAEVWSVTSYKELRRDALETERWNLLHPAQPPRLPYVADCLKDADGPIVAATDYLKALPDSIARWLPAPPVSLGTDGFGRSDSRAALRDFFEVDARYIVVAALSALARENKVAAETAAQAMKELAIDPEKPNPAAM